MNFRRSAGALAIAAVMALPCLVTAQAEGTTLRVLKKLVPPSDPGLFKLKIDGVVRANNVGNGGTTGNVHVTPGSHTVSEAAGSGTNLTKYSTTFGGDCDASGHVVLAVGDHKTCIITNTLLGTLRVVKKLSPANSGKFNLTIDGHIYADNVGNNGSTGAVPVQPGNHTVGETAGTGSMLVNYATTFGGDCDANGHVTVPVGVTKTCTIVNKQRHWTGMADMPIARELVGAAVIGQKLYVIGGRTSGVNWDTRLDVYDAATNTWSTKAPMPTGRIQLGVGVVNGILYVVGGEGNAALGPSVLTTVEAYNPATDTWATKASMPTKRGGLAVAVLNGILYAMGGNSVLSGAALTTVEAYNPATDTWSTKAPMPVAQTWHGAATIGNRIYSVGGRNQSNFGSALAVLQQYNPTANTWTAKTSLPSTRYAFAAAAANGFLYAIGGDSGTYKRLEVYNPTTNTWTVSLPMPTARVFFAAGTINDTVYAVGGRIPGNGTVEYKKLEAYGP